MSLNFCHNNYFTSSVLFKVWIVLWLQLIREKNEGSYLEMFDASFFASILQSLVCPMDDLRFDNGGAIWTKFGEKT